jgi:hypothetical protein
MNKEKMLRLTVPEGATGVMIDVQWGGKLKLTDGTGELSIHDSYDHFDEKDLEPAPRPINEIREYIKAVTHMPCACQSCQLKRSILFWAFPTLEKEDWYK